MLWAFSTFNALLQADVLKPCRHALTQAGAVACSRTNCALEFGQQLSTSALHLATGNKQQATPRSTPNVGSFHYSNHLIQCSAFQNCALCRALQKAESILEYMLSKDGPEVPLTDMTWGNVLHLLAKAGSRLGKSRVRLASLVLEHSPQLAVAEDNNGLLAW